MYDKVYQYATAKHMIAPGDTIIAGVSGGADSVCLMALLAQMGRDLGCRIITVHVEHGLRGRESLEDAAFVRSLAKEYNLEYRLYSYDVRAYAREHRQSLEEAARILRYQAFEEAAGETGASRIAVAHHRDDQAETVLLNLFRGSGLAGLRGIPPVRGNIIRPLLCVSRQEIESYLEERQIPYRTDRTNFENTHTRNKIRNVILPYVCENINRQAAAHISKTAEILSEASQFLDAEAKKSFQACASLREGEVFLAGDDFAKLPAILQKAVLGKAVAAAGGAKKDLAAVHLNSLQALFGKPVSSIITLQDGLRARREYGGVTLFFENANSASTERSLQDTHDRLMNLFENEKPPHGEQILFLEKTEHTPTGRNPQDPHDAPDIFGGKETPQEHPRLDISVPGTYFLKNFQYKITFSLTNKRENNIIIPEKLYTKWFDYDKINDALQIRTRQPGDYLVVNRAGGRKKLKDYFIDEKIPKDQRSRILLLAEGSSVLWAMGHRISEAYKITEHTKRILQVHVEGLTNE